MKAVYFAAFFGFTVAACAANELRVTRIDSLSITAAGVDRLEQRGSDRPKALEQVVDTTLTPKYFLVEGAYVPAAAYVPIANAAKPEQTGAEQLADIIAPLRLLSTEPNLHKRAQALTRAKFALDHLGRQTSLDLIKDACQANVVAVAAALGDHKEFTNAIRMLVLMDSMRTGSDSGKSKPQETRAAARPVAPVNPTAKQYLAMLRATDPATVAFPPTRKIDDASLTESVEVAHKVVREAQPSRFEYLPKTTATVKFASLEITPVQASGLSRGGLAFAVKNVGQRVVPIANMAARVTHNGEATEIKKLDADYRLLPGSESVIEMVDSVRKPLFVQPSKEASTITIFDLPVEFDNMGNATRKENLTWSFLYRLPEPEVKVEDPERSVKVKRWKEFRSGVARLAGD